MSYVPTVKARQAEIKALLKAPTSLAITPLFELQKASAPSRDPKSGEVRRGKSTTTDASYFLDDIARLWGEELYVDISRVASVAQRQTWWDLLAALNNLHVAPAKLIPVVGVDDGPASLAAAAKVAAITGRAAIRLDMNVVRQAPASLTGLTASIATQMGLTVDVFDVVLDWLALSSTAPALDVLEADTAAALAALGGAYRSVITIATPQDASFQQEGDWSPLRREWQLWLRLAHAGHALTYGDYVLYSPADPVPARPRYGHLRYSHGDRVHVHRRGVPASGGALAGAFAECCKHVVAQSHWMGPAFSGADQRLHDISTAADKENDAGKWRQLAAEHHFALVADQLVAPPAAPPPGTP